MFKRKCKITFIAHGATIYTEAQRIYDKEDYPPLNDIGEDEILKVAEFIKKRGVKNDKIYVSPSLRTIQSAKILSKELKKDFEIINELMPRNFGIWGGLTFEQVKKKYPEIKNKSFSQSFVLTPKNGETIEDYNKKITSAISNIVEQNHGKRILIVTHPLAIKVALMSVLNVPLESQGNIYIKTGSLSQISYFEDGASIIYCGHTPI